MGGLGSSKTPLSTALLLFSATIGKGTEAYVPDPPNLKPRASSMAGIRTVSRCGATRLRLAFDRVGVQNPIVEMDSDEMTRII